VVTNLLKDSSTQMVEAISSCKMLVITYQSSIIIQSHNVLFTSVKTYVHILHRLYLHVNWIMFIENKKYETQNPLLKTRHEGVNIAYIILQMWKFPGEPRLLPT